MGTSKHPSNVAKDDPKVVHAIQPRVRNLNGKNPEVAKGRDLRIGGKATFKKQSQKWYIQFNHVCHFYFFIFLVILFFLILLFFSLGLKASPSPPLPLPLWSPKFNTCHPFLVQFILTLNVLWLMYIWLLFFFFWKNIRNFLSCFDEEKLAIW